jgi:hypothetical protein
MRSYCLLHDDCKIIWEQPSAGLLRGGLPVFVSYCRISDSQTLSSFRYLVHVDVHTGVVVRYNCVSKFESIHQLIAIIISENVCDNKEIVEANIRSVKISSPDVSSSF